MTKKRIYICFPQVCASIFVARYMQLFMLTEGEKAMLSSNSIFRNLEGVAQVDVDATEQSNSSNNGER